MNAEWHRACLPNAVPWHSAPTSECANGPRRGPAIRETVRRAANSFELEQRGMGMEQTDVTPGGDHRPKPPARGATKPESRGPSAGRTRERQGSHESQLQQHLAR